MTGSSPRLRGTPSGVEVLDCMPVHPRACGEHAASGFARQAQRFIPAPAGNTTCSAVASSVRFIPAPAGNTR